MTPGEKLYTEYFYLMWKRAGLEVEHFCDLENKEKAVWEALAARVKYQSEV